MGSKRVLRGGAWNNNARNVRAANRNGNDPGNRNNNMGFRVAREHGRGGELVCDPTYAATGQLGRRKPSGHRCGSSGSGCAVETSAVVPFFRKQTEK